MMRTLALPLWMILKIFNKSIFLFYPCSFVSSDLMTVQKDKVFFFFLQIHDVKNMFMTLFTSWMILVVCTRNLYYLLCMHPIPAINLKRQKHCLSVEVDHFIKKYHNVGLEPNLRLRRSACYHYTTLCHFPK